VWTEITVRRDLARCTAYEELAVTSQPPGFQYRDEHGVPRAWKQVPLDEYEQLVAHDKEATNLTIDQQAEIGRLATENQRLRAALEWVRDDTELWDAPIVLEALASHKDG
jgi:hypothetical protein